MNNVKITPGISDHDIVSFTVNLAPKKKRFAKRKIYIRKRTDQEKLNQQLRSFAAQFKATVDLQGCLPKNHSHARLLCYNHRKVYIIVKPIKFTIRRINFFWI